MHGLAGHRRGDRELAKVDPRLIIALCEGELRGIGTKCSKRSEDFAGEPGVQRGHWKQHTGDLAASFRGAFGVSRCIFRHVQAYGPTELTNSHGRLMVVVRHFSPGSELSSGTHLGQEPLPFGGVGLALVVGLVLEKKCVGEGRNVWDWADGGNPHSREKPRDGVAVVAFVQQDPNDGLAVFHAPQVVDGEKVPHGDLHGQRTRRAPIRSMGNSKA